MESSEGDHIQLIVLKAVQSFRVVYHRDKDANVEWPFRNGKKICSRKEGNEDEEVNPRIGVFTSINRGIDGDP